MSHHTQPLLAEMGPCELFAWANLEPRSSNLCLLSSWNFGIEPLLLAYKYYFY
jgi:hypothetical protein